MIVGERKPLAEILQMVEGYGKILVLGCGECVTVCMAGGDKEARETALALSIARKRAGSAVAVESKTVERQCEFEYLEATRSQAEAADVVISLACGVGVQAMNMHYADKLTVPGLNTTFMGLPLRQGVWLENCLGCGNCVLDETMGICPVARCSKSMLNGPCGGSQDGKCEVSKETECGWHLIVERLGRFGKLPSLEEIKPPKDWSASHSGGPRKMVREDVTL
jgi:ferredoxin